MKHTQKLFFIYSSILTAFLFAKSGNKYLRTSWTWKTPRSFPKPIKSDILGRIPEVSALRGSVGLMCTEVWEPLLKGVMNS